MKKTLTIFLMILFFVGVDYLTKHIFFDLAIGKKYFLLEPVFNTGISWGFSANLYLIIIFSFLGIILFIVLWKKQYLSSLCFIFFLSGTLGNLLDRIFFGGVRDFISIGNFPVFNFADILLTFAVIVLLGTEIFGVYFFKK